MKVWAILVVALLLAVLPAGTAAASQSPNIEILKRVASTFFLKGWRRESLSELSPIQLFHMQEMERNNAEAQKAIGTDELPEIDVSQIETASHVSTSGQAETKSRSRGRSKIRHSHKNKVDHSQANTHRTKQQAAHRAAELERFRATSNMQATTQTESQASMQQKLLTGLQAANKLLADATSKRRGYLPIYNTARKLGGGIENAVRKKNIPEHVDTQAIEDCMGCRYIWHQVEMDVSNAKYVEDVQASFEHNCVEAQLTELFFKVCEDMYDDMYAMCDDYLSNDWTVEQVCQRARICKEPTVKWSGTKPAIKQSK